MRLAASPAGARGRPAASCGSDVPERASPGTHPSTSVGWTFNVYEYGQVAFQRSFLSSHPSEDEPAPSLPPTDLCRHGLLIFYISRLLDEGR